MSHFSEHDIDRKNSDTEIDLTCDTYDLESRVYDEVWDARFVDAPEAFPGGCGPDFESSEELFPEDDLQVLVYEVLCEKINGKPIRVRSVKKEN